MSEVEIKAQQVVFPPICPICSMPAAHPVTIHKSLWIPGVMSQSVSFPVPFCEHHYSLYARSRRWSILLCFAITTLLIGALTMLAMVTWGDLSVGIADPGSRLFLGTYVCGSLGVGCLGSVFLLPLIVLLTAYLDPPETKSVRKAFRIKSFNVNPGMHSSVLTRVNFLVDNPTYAEALAKANNANLIT